MNNILLSTIKLILMMDISKFIQALPLELQWEIGQYLGLYFPLSKESAKVIINRTNYQRYIQHVLQKDNVEQLKLILEIISTFDNIIKYIIKKLPADCAKFNALECLNYTTEQGYPKHEDATWHAAANGHLACLQYLTEQGYPKDPNAIYWATSNGHLDCLKFMVKQGYRQHPHAISVASLNGHLDCVAYLKNLGIPYYLEYGHLSCWNSRNGYRR